MSLECFLAGNTPLLMLLEMLCSLFRWVSGRGKSFDILLRDPPTRTAFFDPFFRFRRWTDDGCTLIVLFCDRRITESLEDFCSRWNCGEPNLQSALEIWFLDRDFNFLLIFAMPVYKDLSAVDSFTICCKTSNDSFNSSIAFSFICSSDWIDCVGGATEAISSVELCWVCKERNDKGQSVLGSEEPP